MNLHRLRTAILAVWYSLQRDNPFTIRKGFLYFPSSAIHDAKNGTTKVDLERAKEQS